MPSLPKGTKVGDWVIRSELGSGGQGTVWDVKSATTGRSPPRALKACFLEGTTDRARFTREIELLNRCKGAPNILAIVDADAEWIEHVTATNTSAITNRGVQRRRASSTSLSIAPGYRIDADTPYYRRNDPRTDGSRDTSLTRRP